MPKEVRRLSQRSTYRRRIERRRRGNTDVPPSWNPVVLLTRLPQSQLIRHLFKSTPIVRLTRLATQPTPLPVALTETSQTVNTTSQDPPSLPPPAAAPRRRRHAEIPHTVHYRKACRATPGEIEWLATNSHNLGPLEDGCNFCHAKYFSAERTNREQVKIWCCYRGEIDLPLSQECPPELHSLLTGTDKRSREYRDNIRIINSQFAMASFKTSRQPTESHGAIGGHQGHWCFFACGEIYHFAEGPASTQELQMPNLNQYYFLETNEAIQRRQEFLANRIDPATITIIEDMLRRYNPFVRSYKSMAEVIQQIKATENRHDVIDDIVMVFKRDMQGSDSNRRNFGRPEVGGEIAAVFFREDPPENVELKLYPRSAGLHNEIKNLNRLADPMVYPLLFPYGEYGYDYNIKYKNQPQKQVSARQFYRYKLFTREQFSIIHNSQKLFQQYMVDAWIRAETIELWFYRQNQNKFRAVQQRHIQAVLGASVEQHQRQQEQGRQVPVGEELQNIGRPVILPRIFQGGPRNIQRLYLDAMSIVARHGKPDLFITFTCNPHWNEIEQNLEYQQRFEDRLDLVCRVFQLKLLEFLHDIVHKQIYGVCLNYQYAIEFQKRGLPHAHIVVTFINEDRIVDEGDIERIISAEIPDPTFQPTLYESVKNFQVHRKCGRDNPNAPCMKDGICTKFYPKEFAENTIMIPQPRAGYGQPTYKRRQDGRTIQYAGFVYDNRHIVPYNPYATAKYQCHINFELCGTVACIKYLHKYVYKGSDSATVAAVSRKEAQQQQQQQQQGQGGAEGLTERADGGQNVPQVRDEIRNYIDCRYVSSCEAAWRIFEFKLHDRSHAVQVLPVHQEHDRTILLELAADEEDLNNALNRQSKLQAYFQLNENEQEARALYYSEIPEHYTWDNKNCCWNKRRKCTKVIGTLVDILPQVHNMELWHLRLLLKHVRGAKSFEQLRTVNGVIYDTYEATCRVLNLLENHDEYDRCMEEATLSRSPFKLRRLFALLCGVVEANLHHKLPALWNKYLDYLIEDYQHQGLSRNASIRQAYNHINSLFLKSRGPDVTLASFAIELEEEVLTGQQQEEHVHTNTEFSEATSMGRLINTFSSTNLNSDQKKIFNEIVAEALKSSEQQSPKQPRLYFVDGPGGTGKTYLYNCILSHLMKKKFKVLAVAWTGIAATLLIDGKTCHSAFKLPLNLTADSIAGWPLEHPNSIAMREVSIIIWDEAPMTPKNAITAVDSFLRDVKKNRLFMGGVLTVFGGDFRQTLPVIPRGSRLQVINASLKCSPMWRAIKLRKLTVNMRAKDDEQNVIGAIPYSEYLLQLGDGRIPLARRTKSFVDAADDIIEIDQKLIVRSLDHLVHFTFEKEIPNNSEAISMGDKAILRPTNSAVAEINEKILRSVSDEPPKVYFSIDKYLSEPNDDLYIPMDVINGLETASLPPHALKLEIGAIVMLIRNLDISEGLCNGTRLMIKSLNEHIIEVEILTGPNKGSSHWIPKIKTICKDSSIPRPIERFQFPIKLAYAITINKSQGQTLKRVGVYLKRPCFSHGQLYVALSRVGHCNAIRIFVEDSSQQGALKHKNKTFTRNVVFKQVIEDVNEAGPLSSEDIQRTSPEHMSLQNPQNASHASDALKDNCLWMTHQHSFPNQTFENLDMPAHLDGQLEPYQHLIVDPIPKLSTQERITRVSTMDKPGTSGLQLRSAILRRPPTPDYDDSD